MKGRMVKRCKGRRVKSDWGEGHNGKSVQIQKGEGARVEW